MKFRLTKQRILFGGDEQITDKNRTHMTEIEADDYKRNFDEVLITSENLEYAQKYLNSDYKVGDTHRSPIKSISFIKDGVEIDDFNILADPYYKLEKLDNNGNWELVDKHNCGRNH
jgi:hypothetical protein